MRAHLLNWLFGSAFFGAFFAYHGYQPVPGVASFLEVLLSIVRCVGFLGGGILVLTSMMVVVQRFIEGRVDWPQVRLIAAVMCVKVLLIFFVLLTAVNVYHLAGQLLGGWQGGWVAGVVGACVGAVIGLLAGLFVAWLRIPERLGLNRPAGELTCNEDRERG